MPASGFRSALESRYDGPLPLHASAPPDWHRPWREQVAERKRLAWLEVRRLGREMVAARRTVHASQAPADQRDWIRTRGSLDHALKTWGYYRDQLRNLAESPTRGGN